MWLLAVLSVAAAVLPDAAAAGRTRIVGGEVTTIQKFPHQVSLEYLGYHPAEWGHHCGGSVLAAQWVVTAAHCVAGEAFSRFRVRAGSTSRESGGSVVAMDFFMTHPSYKRDQDDYDVALISLKSPLSFSDVIQPVALPAADSEPSAGQEVFVTGWGYLKAPTNRTPQQQQPTLLQSASVQVVDRKDCQKANAEVSRVTRRMICAMANGRDACQKDSGGPLTLADASGSLTLVGVVSWGNGCAERGHPGVYANLGNAEIRRFISNIADL